MFIKYKSVSDFGNLITGKTPSTKEQQYWDGDIPFITPTDIIGYNMHNIFETERTVSREGAAKQINTILPKETICVSCIASIGKMCLTTAEKSITNQQINSIIVNKEYNTHYVFYLLRYFLPYMQLIGGGTGSGTPIISKNKFGKFKYPVVEDKKFQNRIATILSTYDNLIEVNNKRIKVLEQMAENLYKEWFVRFRFLGYETAEFENGIPKGWEYITFSTIYDYSRGVSYSTEEIECNEGKNLINLKNIQGYGGFRRDGTKKYDGKYKNDQIVKYKDLIMGVTDMTQDRRTVGAVALIPNLTGIISADLIKMISPVNNVFSYCLFRFGGYSQYISQFGNGANVIHLKPSSIKNVKILFPNQLKINEFTKIVEPFIDEIDSLNQKNDNLIKQRDLLLPRLMSGKLEV